MKVAVICALGGIVLLGASATTQAENQWSNYRGVDTTKYQHRPHYPQTNYPHHNYPQNSYPQNSYPQNNYPQNRPYYPQHPSHHQNYPTIQNGISIQYQAPTTITHNSQSYSWVKSYSWVNGDPNTARIESSSYTLITDWKRLGLPAPPNGTYWIFENGRYVLVPNR